MPYQGVILLCLLVTELSFARTAAATSIRATPASPPSDDLDYVRANFYFEQHGRDDLREWRSTVLKGATYIKFDLHFIPEAVICKLMKRLDTTSDFHNGCFVIAHHLTPFGERGNRSDSSSGDPFDYNTTADVAAFLSDYHNRPLLMRNPLVFQVCLKNVPQLCNNLPDGNMMRWLRLLADFYSEVNPILKTTLQGNVKFVLDSIPYSPECLTFNGLCEDWPITWVGAPTSVAVSNNYFSGASRYQLPNMDYTNPVFVELMEHNLYKFRESDFAIVGWEPAGEIELLSFYDGFLNAGIRHKPGIFTAFNSDPAMWHTFTSEATQRFSHQPFGEPMAESPFVAHAATHDVLITVHKDGMPLSPVMVGVHHRHANGRFTVTKISRIRESKAHNFTALGDILGAEVVEEKTDGMWLAIFGSGWILYAWLSNESWMVSDAFVSFSSLGFVDPNANAVAASLRRISTVASNGNTSVLVVYLYISPQSIGTIQTIEALLLACPSPAESKKAPESRCEQRAATTVSAVPPGLVVDGGLAVSFTVLLGGAIQGVAAWSSTRNVYAAAFEFAASRLQPVVLHPPIEAAWSHVGIGRHPSIDVVADPTGGGDTTVLFTYGWSFCFNTEVTDDSSFIMAGTKVCDLNRFGAVEFSEQPVNAYLYGSWSLFAAAASRYSGLPVADRPRRGFANSCSDGSDAPFHGVFDLGMNANAKLVPRREDDSFVAEGGHIGVALLVSLYVPSLSTCGSPLAHNGRPLLSTFPLMGQFPRNNCVNSNTSSCRKETS